MIDISPTDLQTVLHLISAHFPQVEVRVFGSRYKWTAKDYSDLDLVLVGEDVLDPYQVSLLSEALAESDLPFRVDVLDWHDITPEFQAVINAGYEVIQKGKTGGVDWKQYILNEILAIPLRNGVNKPSKVRGNGYKMVNMGELFANSIIREIEMERVPMSESELKNYLLKKGDLLFARQSLTVEGAGKCSLFWSNDEQTTYEGHLIRARTNPEIVLPQYLYYYFLSHEGKNKIKSLVTVTAAAGIRGSDLGNLKILLPPISKQKIIINILSALDEKIELNRQTNATLEAIAQAIFKEWFVNFNYPGATGEMVESELGLIPAGWRVRKLGSICEFIKGVSYKSSELQPSTHALVTLKSINRGGGFKLDGFKEYVGSYKNNQLLKEGDLVIAQTDITQNADVVGCPALVQNIFDYEILIASLDVIICKPKESTISSESLFYFLKHQSFKDYCLSHTNGSTVLHLRSSEIPNYLFVLPSDNLLTQFNLITQSITKFITTNLKQNQYLTQIRDALLPKLMRGKIV
jgi:type I restriction enzyme S subunit